MSSGGPPVAPTGGAVPAGAAHDPSPHGAPSQAGPRADDGAQVDAAALPDGRPVGPAPDPPGPAEDTRGVSDDTPEAPDDTPGRSDDTPGPAVQLPGGAAGDAPALDAPPAPTARFADDRPAPADGGVTPDVSLAPRAAEPPAEPSTPPAESLVPPAEPPSTSGGPGADDTPTAAVPIPDRTVPGPDDEATRSLPLLGTTPVAPRDPFQTDPTAAVPPVPADAPPPAPSAPAPAAARRPRVPRRAALVAAAVLGVLVLLYGIDLLVSRGEVPRGATVAGVDVGGLDRAAAEERLRAEIEPRLGREVSLRAGDVDASLDPAASGLELDWPATLDRAGEQPLNPWTRLTSLLGTREVGVVTSGDPAALAAALEGLRPETDRAPAEGTIRFEGTTPVPVDPLAGQELDVPAARDVVLDRWARGETVEVPVRTLPVTTTPDGVRAAVTGVAEPAVAGPVTVPGEGAEGVLAPEVIASALRFAPDGQGGLTTTVDNPTVIAALGPQLAPSEQPGADASIRIEGGRPVVTPSTEGRGVDWAATLAPLPDVLRRADDRTAPAVYVRQPAAVPTEQVEALGITAVVGEFRTGGFASDSGRNVRRAAEQVDGALVRPGETFSLNAATGPRNASTGYVEAGIIDDGRPGRGVGGGVSQFATTLYNASYFAGMVDVEHKEHSYYISRYPAGREATVFEGSIDLRFLNDGPTGVLIETVWTSSDITVRLWGTKRFDVESVTGPRTDYTGPPTREIPFDEPCSPSGGSDGFTVTDTRVIREVATGREVDRQTRTVVYNPQPRIVCLPEPPPPPDPALPPPLVVPPPPG